VVAPADAHVIALDVAHWFATASHWSGPDGIPARLGEHLVLSAEAMGVAGVLALPLALTLGHLQRAEVLAGSVSNVGRAMPSFAILVLAAQFRPIGLGDTAALVALVALAIPPLVTNTYVGVRSVDPEVREAAVAMGLSGWQLLWQVELPLALPLMLAGIRTSTVQVIATTTLAAEVSAGGLGRYIVDGIAESDYTKVWAGAILVAVLALVAEVVLGRVQALAVPGRGQALALPGGGDRPGGSGPTSATGTEPVPADR